MKKIVNNVNDESHLNSVVNKVNGFNGLTKQGYDTYERK